MAWLFSPEKPVYTQIAERIILSVLSGEYRPGQQIPSVRQLALEAAVNPNTVQHAFSELESKGMILSKGTLGRYVTEDLSVIEACRQESAEQAVRAFVQRIQPLSLPKAQIMKMLEEELS